MVSWHLCASAALVALSVDDHYVHVQTTKGVNMVLMRLANAMRETRNLPALRDAGLLPRGANG